MVPAQVRQPNKRLKLAGGDRSKGSGMLCPWRGTDCRPTALRRLASRPQLKRDPLGGALPPHKHPFVSIHLVVTVRGAERRDARGNIRSPRPTTPSPPRGGRAAHVLQYRACPEAASQGEVARPSAGRAARSRIGPWRAV